MVKRQEILLLVIAFLVIVVGIGVYIVFMSAKVAAPQPKRPVVTAPKRTAPQAPKKLDAATIDNRRRTAAGYTIAMLQDYADSNEGSYPINAETLRQAVDTYGKMIASSTIVTYKSSYNSAELPAANEMFFYPKYSCSGTEPVASTSRSVAVRYILSAGTVECVDNS